MTDRQKKYINERSKGKNKKQSALDAGYSESTALRVKQHIETPEVRAAFAVIIRKRIPAEKIAKRISEGLDAIETKFFQHEGVITDQRDVIAWSERRQYAALAAEFGDYVVPKRPAEAGTGVNILLNFQRDPMVDEVVIPEKPSV